MKRATAKAKSRFTKIAHSSSRERDKSLSLTPTAKELANFRNTARSSRNGSPDLNQIHNSTNTGIDPIEKYKQRYLNKGKLLNSTSDSESDSNGGSYKESESESAQESVLQESDVKNLNNSRGRSPGNLKNQVVNKNIHNRDLNLVATGNRNSKIAVTAAPKQNGTSEQQQTQLKQSSMVKSMKSAMSVATSSSKKQQGRNQDASQAGEGQKKILSNSISVHDSGPVQTRKTSSISAKAEEGPGHSLNLNNSRHNYSNEKSINSQSTDQDLSIDNMPVYGKREEPVSASKRSNFQKGSTIRTSQKFRNSTPIGQMIRAGMKVRRNSQLALKLGNLRFKQRQPGAQQNTIFNPYYQDSDNQYSDCDTLTETVTAISGEQLSSNLRQRLRVRPPTSIFTRIQYEYGDLIETKNMLVTFFMAMLGNAVAQLAIEKSVLSQIWSAISDFYIVFMAIEPVNSVTLESESLGFFSYLVLSIWIRIWFLYEHLYGLLAEVFYDNLWGEFDTDRAIRFSFMRCFMVGTFTYVWINILLNHFGRFLLGLFRKYRIGHVTELYRMHKPDKGWVKMRRVRPTSWLQKFVGLAKLFIDQLFYNPFIAFLYLFALQYVDNVMDKSNPVLRDAFPKAGQYWRTLKAMYCVWPAAQIINICFLQDHHRDWYIQCIVLIWNTVLTYTSNSADWGGWFAIIGIIIVWIVMKMIAR